MNKTYGGHTLQQLKEYATRATGPTGLTLSGPNRRVTAFYAAASALPDLIARIEELESQPQQSFQYREFIKEVREARRLWLDAYPTEDGTDCVTPFDQFLYVDRCPSHPIEQPANPQVVGFGMSDFIPAVLLLKPDLTEADVAEWRANNSGPLQQLEHRTDLEIVTQTLDIARKFYAAQGYVASEGFKFYESQHPQEQCMWRLACIAQEELTQTDPDEALSNVLDEEQSDAEAWVEIDDCEKHPAEPDNWIAEEAAKAVIETEGWPKWRKHVITSKHGKPSPLCSCAECDMVRDARANGKEGV